MIQESCWGSSQHIHALGRKQEGEKQPKEHILAIHSFLMISKKFSLFIIGHLNRKGDWERRILTRNMTFRIKKELCY